MKSWLLLLSGFLVWTVHFFGLYAIGEIDPQVHWVVALTLVCLAANLLALFLLLKLPAEEHFSRWRRSVAAGGIGLSLLAVAWQSLAGVAN